MAANHGICYMSDRKIDGSSKRIWPKVPFGIDYSDDSDSEGGISVSEEDVGCTSPWTQVHRSCIMFIKDVFRTWPDAQAKCAEIKPGAKLVSINDQNELAKLRPKLNMQIDSIDLLDWWIGLEKVAVEDGAWRWVDGEAYHKNLPSWAPSHPGSDDCVVLNYQGKLKTHNCSVEKPIICEENRVTEPPTTSTSSSTTTTTAATTSTKTQVPTKPNTTTEIANTTKTITSTKKPTTTKSTTTTNNNSTDNPNITDKPVKTTTQEIKTEKPYTGVTGYPTIPTQSQELPTTTTTPKSTAKSSKPTQKPTKAPTTPQYTMDQFQGCYAVNHESICPPVEAFGISWPKTEAGKIAIVQCDRGAATWKCDEHPACWRGEADIKQCTSENIQELVQQAEDILEGDNVTTEEAIVFTEMLAQTVESETSMSEQDIYQSTKLMEAAAKAIPDNATDAMDIIKNVLKCGNSLVSSNKKNTWSSMTKENKRTSAASLLTAMESVSMAMLTAFKEPMVEKIQEENMAVELHVIDVNKMNPTDNNVLYRGDTNTFAIPPETLQAYSTDGLAKLVFIDYDTMDTWLVPENVNVADTKRQVISRVISASLENVKTNEVLPKPISFTMQTKNRELKQEDWKQMCSFWNFSLHYTGGWSQKNCSLKQYNDTHTTCQCNHLTNFAILMDIHKTKISDIHSTTLSYITYVGIIISTICLFLSWVTFTCLSINCMRSSRNSQTRANLNFYEYGPDSGSSGDSSYHARTVQGERNSIHKNLVFVLFIAEVLFLAGVERTDHKIACAIIAGCLHFFFLSSFTWMFLEGIHILFMLVQVFDSAKSRMKQYYIIGYGGPLLVVGISALVYHEGYGTEQYCWLTTERFFLWSFAGPVAFILLVNLLILIYAMSAVCKHSEYVFSKEKSTGGNIKAVLFNPLTAQMKEHMKRHQAWVQGAMALEVLLGLTWVFGYFYINEGAIPMAYLFTIFNSLQGLFIFIFHCLLNKKVRKEYERFIAYKPKMTTGTHTTSKSANGSHSGGVYAPNGTRKHSQSTANTHVNTTSTTVALSDIRLKDRNGSTTSV